MVNFASPKWLLWTSATLGLSFGMIATELAPSDLRTPVRVLKVEIDKSSPAYAALEDSRMDYLKSQVVEGEVLQSGELFVFESQKARELESLKIAQSEKIVNREMPALAVSVEGSAEFEAPTVVETAEMLVQQELKNRQDERELEPFKVAANSRSQTIYTKSGSPITIERMPSAEEAKELASAPAPAFRDPFSPTVPTRVVAVNYNPTRHRKPASQERSWLPTPTESSAPTLAMADTKKPAPRLGFMSNDEESESPAKETGLISVRGPIRFINGMAFSPGEDEITIYQEYGSGYVGAGAFYFNQGQYQIPVTEAKGRIIAEVRNRDGDLIGRGQLDVRTLADKLLKQSIVNDAEISISPAQSAFVGEIQAAASSFKTLASIDDAKLVIADLNREIIREPRAKTFVDQGFRLGSTALMRGSASGYWSSLSIAESGSPFHLGLFADNVVSAMLSLASKNKFEARDNEDKAIIWGRVTVEGKPVQDASVVLLSEPEINAVYFNGVIPDRQRVTTSANGEFVFVGATNSIQVIQATIKGRKQVPVFAFAEKKSVTQVDYIVTNAKPIEFSAVDSSTGNKLPMRYNFVGSDKYSEMLKPTSKIVRKALPLGLSMVEFDTGEEYAMTRVALDGHEREVSAPMFRSDWANGFGKGLVVGEIDGDTYMVSFDGDDYNDATVSYLDKDGNKTPAQHGQPGQRFVISGLSQGFHTISIIPGSSRQVLTQIVYVDDQAIHFVKASLD